jgi:hypothetical protein
VLKRETRKYGIVSCRWIEEFTRGKKKNWKE